MKNNSVMKCCVCNNKKSGEFITIDNKKYHLCCIEQLKDNWVKLKEYLINAEQIYKESDDEYVKDMHEMGIRHAYKTILYKMQELERSDNQ